MDATMETPPSRESDLHVAAPEAFLGDLLSTHPSSQSRIHDLYEYATTILCEFQLATDKLAFARVMRDSTARLPMISTAEKRVVTNDEGQAVDPGWEIKSKLARRNACLMGGDKGHAIRALLEDPFVT
ncbi:hypothetical protein DYB30_010330 [Aphanomyces astaci]|nr:hypothetical protein DYB36_001523 [Aphanomyces astaci]RHY60947.1 hypothetical protein DYB30_010330 [Aphanomyces astaci]RHY78375.1 hypothetical protein DYB38_007527 [Aphanomyces astaci]RHZ28597.1 hypothetical protein DYB31_016313 [Aphanomyces astaci]